MLNTFIPVVVSSFKFWWCSLLIALPGQCLDTPLSKPCLLGCSVICTTACNCSARDGPFSGLTWRSCWDWQSTGWRHRLSLWLSFLGFSLITGLSCVSQGHTKGVIPELRLIRTYLSSPVYLTSSFPLFIYWPHGLWELSSPTRDWTQGLSSCQGIPAISFPFVSMIIKLPLGILIFFLWFAKAIKLQCKRFSWKSLIFMYYVTCCLSSQHCWWRWNYLNFWQLWSL